MYVTIDQLKEAIKNQSHEVEEMIANVKEIYKNDGDPKYIRRINALKLVLESNEQVLNLNWEEVSPKDRQLYYNVLLSHQNKYHTSN